MRPSWLKNSIVDNLHKIVSNRPFSWLTPLGSPRAIAGLDLAPTQHIFHTLLFGSQSGRRQSARSTAYGSGVLRNDLMLCWFCVSCYRLSRRRKYVFVLMESRSNRRPVSPNEGWDPFTMSFKCSGSVTTSSAGSCSFDRATDRADIGTNFPTHVLHGRTTSSALGLIIRTFAEHVDASTSVCPTTTPKSSVNCREGTINAHVPNWPPVNAMGATTSQSGGSTTAVSNNPFIFGVGFCWCNCNVARPSALSGPVRRSSWCGRHDCRASVPNNPSEPTLATMQPITHLSPGKTTSNSSSPIAVNGEEFVDINRCVQGRILDIACGSAAHILSNTDVANIVTWQPVSIMNSTSIPLVHPVRNQGAADPTAPTTIASPSSGCSCTSVMDCSLPRHGVTLGTECSNGLLPVSFQHEAELVITSECSNRRISTGPSWGHTNFSTPECSNGWEPTSSSVVINLHSTFI